MNIDYTNIANGNYKPTKRADMLAQLEKIAEYIPADNIEAGNVLNSIAAAFARHTKKSFVASAASKDQTRLALIYIFNDAAHQQTVATDGRRLHIETGVAYDKDCFLCSKTLKRVETEMVYPNYKNLMPETSMYLTFKMSEITVSYDKDHACFDIDGQPEIYFNKAFILDLGDLSEWIVKVAPVDAFKSPVVFEDDNKKAVIMPYRKK